MYNVGNNQNRRVWFRLDDILVSGDALCYVHYCAEFLTFTGLSCVETSDTMCNHDNIVSTTENNPYKHFSPSSLSPSASSSLYCGNASGLVNIPQLAVRITNWIKPRAVTGKRAKNRRCGLSVSARLQWWTRRPWGSLQLSVSQSVFYFMSVHSKVILDPTSPTKIYILISYTSLPIGLWTINLEREIIKVLQKI